MDEQLAAFDQLDASAGLWCAVTQVPTPFPGAAFLRRMPHVPPWLSGRSFLHG